MKKIKRQDGTWKMDPFAGVPVLGAIDSTPEEIAVYAGLHFLYMWLGDRPVGIEAIEAVLINPDQPKRVKAGGADAKEELGQISRSGIQRALARMKARDRVAASKGFGQKTEYSITCPAMTNTEGQKIVKARMSEKLRLHFFPKEAPDPTPDLFAQAPAVMLERATGKPPAPGEPGGGPDEATLAAIAKAMAKRDQDAIWAHWAEGYAVKHNQRPTWPAFKWVAPAIHRLIEQHGVAEIKRRMTNCLQDPFASAQTFGDFLAKPDRWIQKREPFKTTAPARPFHAPPSDWKPNARPH